MKSKIVIRYSKKTKEAVVTAIITGELWLEEAMVKYGIHDRRTVIDWLRKYKREEKRNNISPPMDFEAEQGASLPC